MSPFARTLVLGIGMLGMFVLTALVTGLILLKRNGTLDEWLRDNTLTERERLILAEVQDRPPEPPPVAPRNPVSDVDQTIARIANQMNQSSARDLLARLSQREHLLDERAAYIDQREAELALTEAEIGRLQREFDQRSEGLRQQMTDLEAERANFAQLRAEELRQVSILGEVQRKQWQVVAQRYSAMRRPWELLRELPVEDIAHIIAFMDSKRSAAVLQDAINDRQRPDLPIQIHQRIMAMDTTGLSGNQAQRFANLYQHMKPAEVLPYLDNSNDDEVAQIIASMPNKKQAALLEELQRQEPVRGQAIQQRLTNMTLAGDAGNGAAQ